MTDGGRKARALLIVITDYPGGAERVTFSLAKELAARTGWLVEVKVVCSRVEDSFSERVLPSCVGIRYGPFRNWYLSFLLLPFRLMFRRYDLVFTTHIYTNALLSLARRARLIRIKRLVFRESMSLFDRFGGLKARRFRWLYRAYGAEDLIIAQTTYMADHVRPWLPPRSSAHLRSLPNPADTKSIETASKEPLDPATDALLRGKRNILFCGRLVDFKRPEAALETFRIAQSGNPNAQMIFLGDGPLASAVREQAVKDGLADRVQFLGFQSNPYPIMAACEFGVVTSANEGFPNVIIEMMACGLKKIVTTPCAGDLDQLSGVTVTRSFDEHEIAAALRDAIERGENCGATYRRVAAARLLSVYLDAVLGFA